MKKIFVIVFLMPLTFLTACTSQETTPNQTIDSPKSLTGVTETSSTTKIIEVTPESNSGGTIVDQKLQISEIAINTSSPVNIYSPVYTISGSTLSDTTKVEVVFSGTTKTDKYFLTKFKTGDSEFLVNLRLDYGNIEKGKNFYEVRFYKGEEILGSEKYEIIAEYDEVKIGGNVIYVSKKLINNYFFNRDEKENHNYDSFCSSLMNFGNSEEKFLLNENGKFRITDNDCISFSAKENYYLEIKNIHHKNELLSVDVYINGKKIISNFELVPVHPTKEYYIPEFIKHKKLIYGNGNVYDIESKKIFFSKIVNYGMYERGHYIFYIGGGEILIYGRLENDKTSVFSILTGNFRENYIYDGNLDVFLSEKIKNNDFLEHANDYSFPLGNKNFIIDFESLKNRKNKMGSLYNDKEAENKSHLNKNTYNLDGYNIYLHKNKNGFILKFDKTENSSIEIKTIGITSCKPNNSPEYDQEYILKTQTDELNFTYNISEELSNKCDIPYKIQVTYEDGTKEVGEYYILFDY